MPGSRPAGLLCAGLLACAGPACAQIAADGTLGTAIGRSGNAWSITAGTQLGGNLFHSFSQFSVPTGHSATFSGPTSVQNIIGRVTGPDPSTIDGLLRSTIPGASLWLINPRGIAFGANASLDIPGSFHVSTADYLKLGAAGEFRATNPGASTLAVDPPSAFGFLTASPAAVTFIGPGFGSPLVGVPGSVFSVAAGRIDMDGVELIVPGGRIDLATVAGAGEVAATVEGMSVPPGMLGGAVTLNNSVLDTDNAATAGGPRVAIRGGTLQIVDTYIYAGTFNAVDGRGIHLEAADSISLDFGRLYSDSFGVGRAGPISIVAPTVALSTATLLNSDANAAGAGGTVSITADALLRFSGSSRVSTRADASGPAGSAVIRAGDFELLQFSSIETDSTGAGSAGTVDIATTGLLRLDGQSSIQSITSGSGPGGRIEVNAAGGLLMLPGTSIAAEARGSARGGDVVVRAGTMQMDGATISTDARAGGAAGNVTVDVTGRLDMRNESLIAAQSHGAGAGGNVTVGAGMLVLTGWSEISAGAFAAGSSGNVTVNAGDLVLDRGYINAETQGAGAAGDVAVHVERSLRIAGGAASYGELDSGITSASLGTGDGGTILVQASLLEVDGGYIASTALDAGRAGSVTVEAGRVHLKGIGVIDASTFGQGDAGNVSVTASESVRIEGTGGRLVWLGESGLRMRLDTGISSASFSAGDGGSLSITAPSLAMDGGIIRTSSTGSGLGGSILIEGAKSVQLTGGARISAETRSTDGGDIRIVAKDLVYLADSAITTSVANGTGNGGNIFIDPQFVVLDNSQIVAQAAQGNGGNISIVAGNFISSGSIVDASSSLGISGTVAISAPQSDVAAGVLALSSSFVSVPGVSASCAARASLGNSFAVAGRGGLPDSPDSGYAPVLAGIVAHGPKLADRGGNAACRPG